MKNKFTLLILLFAGLWLTACNNNKTPIPDPVDEDPKTMIMFGKISGFYGNLNSARLAVADGALIEGQRLLVYYDNTSQLFEIVRDKSQKDGYREIVVQTYDRTVSSLNPERMRQILEDAQDYAPANHYGLSVGVHGFGWVPVETGSPQARHVFSPLYERLDNQKTRNLNQELNVTDFAGVLDGLGFDFVILDACFMSSVEALYDLRNAAQYIIASPAEILMSGFPFYRLINRLFDDWSDLGGVCDEYVDYYLSSSDPNATIALIKTSELENLAKAVRAIYVDGVTQVDPVSSKLQYYENMVSHIFYDFDQYISVWTDNETLYGEFVKQMDKTVVHKRTTDFFYSAYNGGKQVPVTHFSGLTAYVPQPAKYPAYYAAYQNTSWYKYVYEGVE